jgi:hypothetical protein
MLFEDFFIAESEQNILVWSLRRIVTIAHILVTAWPSSACTLNIVRSSEHVRRIAK